MQKITIIGGGNLGSALALGLQKNDAWSVTVTGRKAARLAPLAEAGIATNTDNRAAVADADWIVFCVQPGQMEGVLADLQGTLQPKQHKLVSTATGLSLATLAQQSGPGFTWVRAMPNTASGIGESITCLSAEHLSDAGWDICP